MKKIKGPAIFLAQFADDKEPFNSLKGITLLSSGNHGWSRRVRALLGSMKIFIIS